MLTDNWELAHLLPETLSALQHKAHELVMNKGDVIFTQNEKSDGFYILLRGMVSLTQTTTMTINPYLAD